MPLSPLAADHQAIGEDAAQAPVAPAATPPMGAQGTAHWLRGCATGFLSKGTLPASIAWQLAVDEIGAQSAIAAVGKEGLAAAARSLILDAADPQRAAGFKSLAQAMGESGISFADLPQPDGGEGGARSFFALALSQRQWGIAELLASEADLRENAPGHAFSAAAKYHSAPASLLEAILAREIESSPDGLPPLRSGAVLSSLARKLTPQGGVSEDLVRRAAIGSDWHASDPAPPPAAVDKAAPDSSPSPPRGQPLALLAACAPLDFNPASFDFVMRELTRQDAAGALAALRSVGEAGLSLFEELAAKSGPNARLAAERHAVCLDAICARDGFSPAQEAWLFELAEKIQVHAPATRARAESRAIREALPGPSAAAEPSVANAKDALSASSPRANRRL